MRVAVSKEVAAAHFWIRKKRIETVKAEGEFGSDERKKTQNNVVFSAISYTTPGNLCCNILYYSQLMQFNNIANTYTVVNKYYSDYKEPSVR